MISSAAVGVVRPSTRSAEERFFRATDGVNLFYRHWPGSKERVVLLIHRGHEHSGRMAHLVDEFEMPEVSFFAWDARGHGRSEDTGNSSVTMSTFVQDLDEFVRHIRTEFRIQEQNIAIVAQSIGAVFATTWVHDYAPAIRCMVLAAPAFRIKLYVPFARQGLLFWHTIAGDYSVKSYVRGSALTRDQERAASYHRDPLIRLHIPARLLLDLFRTSRRIVQDAAAVRVPTQVLLSGSDWVVSNTKAHQFFQRLGTDQKEVHVFEGFRHDTLGEKERQRAITKSRSFLSQHFEKLRMLPSLQNADEGGFTRREYDTMARELPWWSVKGFCFAATKCFLHTVGRLSEGIRLGVNTGFDSGSSLDYVYRNQPSGITPLGRIIDWFYLNAPGWRGIRVRRQLLRQFIVDAMAAARSSGQPVRILDVAAGHGRYVLEAIAESAILPDQILLRDFDPNNTAAGRKLIAGMGLSARFETGDAFDRASLAAIRPRPTIAIISGLFELFPANQQVRETLAGLADAMDAGSSLIYTGQPWHPQLEFIARTLHSHRGAPWVMRRRTQEELDELVRTAGFCKVQQMVDPEGLFTVTLAQRI